MLCASSSPPSPPSARFFGASHCQTLKFPSARACRRGRFAPSRPLRLPPPAAAAAPSIAGAGEAVALPLPAAALRRLLHIGSRGGGGGGGGAGEPESVAYRMSMVRRPSSVRKRGLTWNSCSLIGRLNAPVRPYEHSSADYPTAYSFLTVSPSSSSSNFTVTLQLKRKLANVGLKHLKHNDLIYVSGFLRSYHKISPSGDRNIFYQIQVKQLNYVRDQIRSLRMMKTL
ncbi:unnamed protein product [Urochloa humidicola]